MQLFHWLMFALLNLVQAPVSAYMDLTAGNNLTKTQHLEINLFIDFQDLPMSKNSCVL